MASDTYNIKGLVLKKTKLGESDLILTILSSEGQQLRAVAKGARKPTSSFASRMELYTRVDLLLARGKTLDIVKEARLVSSNDTLRSSLELSACASAYAELLTRLTEEGVDNARLFDMSEAYFSLVSTSSPHEALTLCVAAYVKAFAFVGLGAHYAHCISCSSGIDKNRADAWFSFNEGGYLCDSCHTFCEVTQVSTSVLVSLETCLRLPFSQLQLAPIETGDTFACLQLMQQWCRVHVGANLKSLNFLFTSGLF